MTRLSLLDSLVRWLVVSSGAGVRVPAYKLHFQVCTIPHPQPFPRLRGKGVKDGGQLNEY